MVIVFFYSIVLLTTTGNLGGYLAGIFSLQQVSTLAVYLLSKLSV